MEIMGAKEGKKNAAAQMEIIEDLSKHLSEMKALTNKMLVSRKNANKITDFEKKAIAYCDTVRVLFDEIKYHVDKLELLVDDEEWRIPKFREMLFTRQ